jgi:hypothetical protein
MSTMLADAQPAAVAAKGNQLVGHAAVFDQWTRIWTPQGAFLEKVAPGAFRRTLAERGDKVRCVLEHGFDARAGNRPLGAVVSLREDTFGLVYEVDLFDEPYVDELKSALAAGLYSSSFRFRSRVEDFEPRPPKSDHNPQRLPEVVLREVDLYECGPCTFPAYAGATASLRTKGAPPTLTLVPRTRSAAATPTKHATRDRTLLWIAPEKRGPGWQL